MKCTSAFCEVEMTTVCSIPFLEMYWYHLETTLFSAQMAFPLFANPDLSNPEDTDSGP